MIVVGDSLADILAKHQFQRNAVGQTEPPYLRLTATGRCQRVQGFIDPNDIASRYKEAKP
jgi:hypothetical protein